MSLHVFFLQEASNSEGCLSKPPLRWIVLASNAHLCLLESGMHGILFFARRFDMTMQGMLGLFNTRKCTYVSCKYTFYL